MESRSKGWASRSLSLSLLLYPKEMRNQERERESKRKRERRDFPASGIIVSLWSSELYILVFPQFKPSVCLLPSPTFWFLSFLFFSVFLTLSLPPSLTLCLFLSITLATFFHLAFDLRQDYEMVALNTFKYLSKGSLPIFFSLSL